MIKPACSVSFLLKINIVVWQCVLYIPNIRRSFSYNIRLFTQHIGVVFKCFTDAYSNSPELKSPKTKHHVRVIESFLQDVKYCIGFIWLRIKSNIGIL